MSNNSMRCNDPDCNYPKCFCYGNPGETEIEKAALMFNVIGWWADLSKPYMNDYLNDRGFAFGALIGARTVATGELKKELSLLVDIYCNTEQEKDYV